MAHGPIMPIGRVVDVMTDKAPQKLTQLRLIWESERELLIDYSLKGGITIIRK